MTHHKLLLITYLLVFVGLAAAPGMAADKDSLKAESSDEYFVIETRHRMFPDFSQIDTVAIEQPFYIGEEEWEARIMDFNPHLMLTMEGKAVESTDTLYNPAVRIQVEKADSLIQESWGFYYIEAPHFRRDDMLGFKIVDFHVGDQYIPAPPKE